MKIEFNGVPYDVGLEGAFFTLMQLEQEFHDAQQDVPYATKGDRTIADSRDERFRLSLDFMRMVLTALYNAVESPKGQP